MTEYKDWFRDYPTRALSLLQRLSPHAEKAGHEVTLLVSIGSLLLTAPFERLTTNRLKIVRDLSHPQKDRQRSENAILVERFDRLLPDDSVGDKHAVAFDQASFFWGDSKPKGWQYGQLADPHQAPDRPDSWIDPNDKPLSDISSWPVQGRTFRLIFRTMRNAISHGNVMTHPISRGQDDRIAKLIFISNSGVDMGRIADEEFERLQQAGRAFQKFRFVAVTPQAWREFLFVWARFLDEMKGLNALPNGNVISIAERRSAPR